MKISIITAVRNAAATIGAALESVERQTYPDIEHIVVDGLSTDGTMDVVRRHSARLAKVVSERDSGIYDAFNKGLRLATGEVVAFLNADDVYAAPDVLQAVHDVFERSQASAVFGDVEFVRPEEPDRVVRHYSSERFSPKPAALRLDARAPVAVHQAPAASSSSAASTPRTASPATSSWWRGCSVASASISSTCRACSSRCAPAGPAPAASGAR